MPFTLCQGMKSVQENTTNLPKATEGSPVSPLSNGMLGFDLHASHKTNILGALISSSSHQPFGVPQSLGFLEHHAESKHINR